MITKQAESPALPLFITDPEIVRFLRTFEQQLLNHRDKLTSMSTQPLDAEGLGALRRTMASLFPGEDVPARLYRKMR